jgi:mannose-1-phosphate guanylyltransferase
VVQADHTGLIERFIEHGRTFAGNLINAGVYIFSPSIFQRLRVVKAVSMEKEVLPKLVSAAQGAGRGEGGDVERGEGGAAQEREG